MPSIYLSPAELEACHFREYDPLALRAATSIARLSGMLARSPRTRLFHNTWLAREAVAACAMAGIETSLEETLAPAVPGAVKSCRQAAANWRDALLSGLDQLKNHGQANAAFLQNIYHTLNGADRVATPVVQDEICGLMDREDLNPVIVAGLAHAWFMNCRPFPTANTRMALLMIPLFLAHRDLLEFTACCYLNVYFLDRREKYNNFLNLASQGGGLKKWIDFFLRSLIEGCHERMFLLAASESLYESARKMFQGAIASRYATEFADFVFANPVFDLQEAGKLPGMNRQELANILRQLELEGIIEKIQPEKTGARLWKFQLALEL